MELISWLNDFDRGKIDNIYVDGCVILWHINNIKDNDIKRIYYLDYFSNLIEDIKGRVNVEDSKQVFCLTQLDSLIIQSFNNLDPL